MAISTPTKLLTLEEAQSRALANANTLNIGKNPKAPSTLEDSSNNGGVQPSGLPGKISHEQKFFEVGGGQSTLPQKYHTVIDIPGSR